MKKCIMIGSLVIVLLSLSSAYAEEKLPYLNPDLSIEERLDDLTSRTSIQQKTHALMDFSTPIDEGDVRIPGFDRGESLHGLASPKHHAVTVWPIPICLGGTWDDQLIYDMGVMISDEARAQHHHGTKMRVGSRGPLVLYAPGVYLARDPRWGRYQECYGEDPFLVSRLAVAYVKGMQGDHPEYLKTACTTKCFVAYNKEHMRFGYNAEISERWLRDYYFKVHKACFQEANCRSTMTAYNALNGIPCSGNKWLLTDVLKGEWGFTGFIMEDASATMAMAKEDTRRQGKHGYVDTFAEASALALNAGMDFMLCNVWNHHLEDAISQGLTTEAKLNEAFRRVMRVRMELGEFDPPQMSPWYHLPFSTLAKPEHTAHARMVAQKGIVLLKNEKINGDKLLPIDRTKVKSIAVVGPNSQVRTLGIYSGIPKYKTSILEGIKEVAGKDVKINFVPWVKARTEELVSGRSSSTVGLDGVPGWKVEYFNNHEFKGKPVYTTVVDHISINPDTKLPEGITVEQYSIRWRADINPPQDGKYRFNAFTEDYITMTVDGEMVIEERRPHWRIERRAEKELKSSRSYDIVVDYVNWEKNTYIELFWEKPAAALSQEYGEVEAAKNSDVVVAVLGLHERDEGEGSTDRVFPNIAEDQLEMFKKVAAVNPNIIVVLINGSPLTLDTVRDVAPAILEAWYPGQAGIAAADLLFGDVNPSGHLPSTIYKSWDPIGTIDEFDLARGKRTYMYTDDSNVAYPFGFGLSYTEFKFSGLKLDNKKIAADGIMNVKVTVQNTGKVDGSDVVQLYVREAKRTEGRPKRRLVGFKRVDDLKAGQKREVELSFKVKDLENWDQAKKQMCVYPGKYSLEVGQSSADIVLTKTFSVQ